MCMTRLDELPADEPVSVEPMRAFPHVRDLVTDVSWNFRVKPTITRFTPRPPDAPDGTWRIDQEDVDRVQEFRKCIECFLCQDVCHVLRDRDGKDSFVGPRFMIRAAGLEMNPLDDDDRIPEIKKEYGSGMCNITRCCTEVCPEHIGITDNGIIPMKERVVDRFHDPIVWITNKILGKNVRTKTHAEEEAEREAAAPKKKTKKKAKKAEPAVSTDSEAGAEEE
jgi:succinate dehydrogenase / fumarate reductase iron-sulfur subunit